MKTFKLNIIIGILVFFNIASTFAQDSKLKLHSVSIGGGATWLSSDNSSRGLNGGLSQVSDFSVALNKSLFSLYFNAGNDLTIFNGTDESYYEINFTYGREFELKKWLKLEGHFGLGHFKYGLKDKSTNFEKTTTSTIGFPIRLKVLFYTGEHFAIGLNPNTNLNSLSNTISGNLIFQYKF